MALLYRVSSMSVTIPQALLQLVDGGPGFGQLVISDVSRAPICVVTLQKPSFSYSGGTATLLGVPLTSAPAAVGGVAEFAQLCNSNGDVIIGNLSVGTQGCQVNLSTQTIGLGQEVEITAGALTYQ